MEKGSALKITRLLLKKKNLLLENCIVSYQSYSALQLSCSLFTHHQGMENTPRHQDENPETGQQQRLLDRKTRGSCASSVSRPPSLPAFPQLTGDSYLNQCNQRWNDNGDAHCQNCRKLVAQGFPCPCGHAYKDILLACKDNRRKLKATEWWRVPRALSGGVGTTACNLWETASVCPYCAA